MRTKMIILLISVFYYPVLFAQVALDIQAPSAGIILRDNLWNLSVINNSSNEQTVNLSLELKYAENGQIAFTGYSRNLRMKPGVSVINSAQVQPVVYNFLDPDFSRQYLPFGNYILCIKVDYLSGQEEKAKASIECTNIQIDPLSPPMLSFPSDGDTSEDLYPKFAWIPPTPGTMLTDLKYQLVMVQVQPGQKPVEAIRNNLPVYTAANLPTPTGYYPSSYPALDTGNVYAWQIWATNGKGYKGQSEVWTFYLGKKSQEVTTSNNSYIHILKNTGINSITTRMLHVQYYSYEAGQSISFEFVDETGKVVRTENAEMRPGDNYYDFKLKKDFKDSKTYKLKLKLNSGKEYSLYFRIEPKQH